MHNLSKYIALAGCLLSALYAAPTSTPEGGNIENRGTPDGLKYVLDTVNNIIEGKTKSANPFGTILDVLKPVTPTTKLSNVKDATAALSNVYHASPTPKNLIDTTAQLVAQGLTLDNVKRAVDFVDDKFTGENSERNHNPLNPSPAAYPAARPDDAPYSLSEDDLRAAIYIPDTFQYGKPGAPQPIILVPGTGNTGYITFSGNLIPLLQGSKIADPVWLNIPGSLLDDAQTNAEYVAYAINYIYGISNQTPVAVAAWSQGNIDAQWAYKYWPSTRDRVTDHVGFLADYHGTVAANLISIPGAPLPPSVQQQKRDSNFIKTLRSNGGDSSYVPTTSIYSGLGDLVVVPQSGNDASARLLDTRGAGVSNNEVQVVCKGKPAGGLYTHEGVLYNPLAFALLKDALANKGPGQPSRLDIGSVCNDFLTPGLVLADLLLTENALLIAGTSLLVYPDKVSEEPAIRGMFQDGRLYFRTELTSS